MSGITEAELRLLQRRWLHSHEEDTETQSVYRPDSFAFPLARGRSGFEFRTHGKCVEIGIAPTDRGLDVEATWRTDGRSVLISLPTGEDRNLQIVSVDQDCLIIRE